MPTTRVTIVDGGLTAVLPKPYTEERLFATIELAIARQKDKSGEG